MSEDQEKILEDKTQNYGFDTIVYIRGTREGYNKIKPMADNFFQSSENISKVQSAGSGIMTRYLEQRRQIASQYTNKKISLTDEEIIKQQHEYAQALGDSVYIQESGEQVGSTLHAMQETIRLMTESNRVQKTREMFNLIDQLENFYNQLAADDKIDLQAIFDATHLEGKVVNIKNGLLTFSRIRATLDRLSNAAAGAGSYVVNVNREMGALQEALTIFCGGITAQKVDSLLTQKYPNGRFTQVGTQQSKQRREQWGTATADGIFEYTTTIDDEDITLQEVISVKASGVIVDENGKWAIQPGESPTVQIKSWSAQYAVWGLLTQMYGSSVTMQNSAANILVWSSATGQSYQLIKSSLIGGYFERMLAGSGSALSKKLGFDLASCLVVNGTVIPIVDILDYATEMFKSKDFSVQQVLSFINVNIHIENPWKGSKDEKNLTLALQRSQQVMDQIQRKLKIKATLSTNILYQIAKGMTRMA